MSEGPFLFPSALAKVPSVENSLYQGCKAGRPWGWGVGTAMFLARMGFAHLIRASTEDKEVEGDSSHHVNEEPALEVVNGNAAGVADHLVVGVDISGAEVDDNVHNKHDVHNEVHYSEWTAGIAAGTTLRLVLVTEQEGS